MAVGAEADDLKAVGQVIDHVEAVGPDGAGGTEDDQAARAMRQGMAVGRGHDDGVPIPPPTRLRHKGEGACRPPSPLVAEGRGGGSGVLWRLRKPLRVLAL